MRQFLDKLTSPRKKRGNDQTSHEDANLEDLGSESFIRFYQNNIMYTVAWRKPTDQNARTVKDEVKDFLNGNIQAAKNLYAIYVISRGDDIHEALLSNDLQVIFNVFKELKRAQDKTFPQDYKELHDINQETCGQIPKECDEIYKNYWNLVKAAGVFDQLSQAQKKSNQDKRNSTTSLDNNTSNNSSPIITTYPQNVGDRWSRESTVKRVSSLDNMFI